MSKRGFVAVVAGLSLAGLVSGCAKKAELDPASMARIEAAANKAEAAANKAEAAARSAADAASRAEAAAQKAEAIFSKSVRK
jgi:hypothetical protein